MANWKRLSFMLMTALLLTMLVQTAVLAGPFEDGKAAFARQDYKTALKIWQPLAEKGNAEAQVNLGMMYYEGDGITKNETESLKWFRKAADQGNADAQHTVGLMYESGKGVKQSFDDAFSWYGMAADQGHAKAQEELADCYAAGFGYGGGGPYNVGAYEWYLISSMAGNKDTAGKLDAVAAKMTPEEIAEAKRFAAAWKPTPSPSKQ